MSRSRRSPSALLAVGSLLVAVTLPLGSGPATAERGAPPAERARSFVAATSSRVTLLGRWDRTDGVATTVNSGSRVLLRFTGRQLTAVFDQEIGVTLPPEVYVRIDGGDPRRYRIDDDRFDLAPQPLPRGRHRLVMAVKDVDERDNRWQFPFASALRVEGFFLAPGGRALRPPRPHGPRIEFLGDSITQGVRAVGPNIGVRGSDATRDYAWITGQAFGGDFRQTGFGAQGITRPGGGGVPPAPETLGLNFAGSPIDSWTPDAVVVNQGTNDALNDSLDGFTRAYQDYLRDIRERWPDTWVFAMRPFGGYAESRIRKAVRRLDDPRVVYVDTSGWIRPLRFTDGLHPSYSGHLAAARHLRRVVEETTGWQAGRIGGARVRLLAAGGTGGFEGRSTAWGPGRNVAAVRTRPASTPAAYQGERTLRVRPTPGAPATDWHTVVLDEPVRLPREARSVFVFAAVDGVDFGAPFDARVRVVRDGTRHTKVFREVPNLPGFLPWSRLHVNLPRGGDATRISVAVRAATFGATGPVGFQLDAVGWTSRWNG